MKRHSLEWLDKAEGDLDTARREIRARKRPNYDAACFHAQQCVEKLFKATLVEHNRPFPRVHDLEVLLDACIKFFPLWESLRKPSQLLTQYAVSFRYPGDSAVKEEASQALRSAEGIFKEVLSSLNIQPPDC